VNTEDDLFLKKKKRREGGMKKKILETPEGEAGRKKMKQTGQGSMASPRSSSTTNSSQVINKCNMIVLWMRLEL